MPELPEVETVARQLDPELAGLEIEALEVLDARWSRPVPPERLGAEVAGSRIRGLGRRGKYLLLGLDGDRTLVMHLRMTGNLVLVEGDRKLDPSEGMRLYEGERTVSERHLRARFRLEGGGELWFTDPRRFGEAFLLPDEALAERFAKLGVEPLSPDFTPELLGAEAEGRTAPLKSFLLDQSRLAGVGNIYADEALFRARLHPLSPAGSTRPEHHQALRDGVVAAREAGLEPGGASIDDYRAGRGDRGEMQDEFLVHTREGEPCPRCDGTVTRIVVGGRSTYYCPSCQVRLRRRPKSRRRAAPRRPAGRSK
jgi:formamidopyrimidine-DNA glycosylase